MKDLDKFNWLAGIYDSLVRVVFGRSLYEAQLVYLEKIPKEANVLFLGGGTGQALKHLLSVHPTCTVWYVEASSSMIEKATKCVGEISAMKRVHFIHGTHESVPESIRFDVVVANFFLDLFYEELPNVIAKIKDSLRNNGQLLVTDFVDGGKNWQRVMLRLMYWFFRITCGIEARRLPPWEQRLFEYGFIKEDYETFFNDFIKSVKFRLETSV